MPPATRTLQYIEMLLQGSLEDWVAARRQEGLSWRAVSAELEKATDGRGYLSRETLRTRFAEVDPGVPLGRTA